MRDHGRDPFGFLDPLIRRYPRAEAQELLAVIGPFDLSLAPREPLRVADLTSIPCERFVRVMHALGIEGRDLLGGTWAWSQVFPGQIHPETDLHDVLRAVGDTLEARGIRIEPPVGRLAHHQASVIARGLRDVYGPSRCAFYFWDGLGLFGSEGPHVYESAVDAVVCFLPSGSADFESPTIWWSGREWWVATHPDSTSTYVGCGAIAAERLLASGLEAISVGATDRVDDWTDWLDR